MRTYKGKAGLLYQITVQLSEIVPEKIYLPEDEELSDTTSVLHRASLINMRVLGAELC